MMRRKLAKKTRDVLQSTTDEERIRRIRSSRWIDYKAAQVVRGKLNDLLTHPFSLRMPNLLHGSCGAAKKQPFTAPY